MTMNVPLDMFRAGLAGAQMAAEAQAVITYRLFGMAGIWSVTPSENNRMVSEKGPALMAANLAAWNAAMKGGRPDEIYSAWLKPIGRRTRSNARRLGRRGLKQPG
ncbi:antifreeze protein [Palleronia sp. LCG004]|uniref:antifreeze protein n=1 Tax=Palleronia sp. LCG004 TaxID=3079304 RepID=UPI002941F2C4|nr:antifreeze protein [Palleronia sp. LCG004]WOI55733.1 antifreeze protein [Palleronia sp. LCG004]